MGFDRVTHDEELENLALVIDGGSLAFALDPAIAADWLRLVCDIRDIVAPNIHNTMAPDCRCHPAIGLVFSCLCF
jgi:hypothetical protein